MDLMITVNRIEELCKNKNISVNKMLSDIGLSAFVIRNMKNGSAPSVDKMIAIAEYFDVSMDYLLGADISDKNTYKGIYADFFSSLSEEELKKVYELAKISLDR